MIFLMWKYKIVDKISTQTMQSAFDEGHWIKMYLIDKTGVESSNRPNKLLISIQHTYSRGTSLTYGYLINPMKIRSLWLSKTHVQNSASILKLDTLCKKV